MQIKTNESKFNRKPSNKPSCLKCGHIVICAIYKAVKPLMGNWDEENSPFMAEDMACICKKYAETFIEIKHNSDAEENDGR